MNDRFHEDVSDFIFFCLLECLFFLHHLSGFGLVGTNLLLFEGTELLSLLLNGEKERCLVTNIIKLDSINNLFNLLPWANKPTPQLTHKTKHVFSCNVSMERTFPQGSKSHEVLLCMYTVHIHLHVMHLLNGRQFSQCLSESKVCIINEMLLLVIVYNIIGSIPVSHLNSI